MQKDLNISSKQESSKIYEERFERLMKLIRIDKMLRTATIIHKDNPSENQGKKKQ